MLLTLDSTFKRALFIAIVIAISTIFAFTAFFYLTKLNQQGLITYLIVIEFLVLITFFVYRNYITPKHVYVKRLKNPRLQENAFEISEILLKEFDYIRETSIQINNDRQNMSQHYLYITGSVLGATIVPLLVTRDSISSQNVFAIILAASCIINFIGWIYFMQLMRLRQAWCDSATAMNQIKEFFIVNGRVPDDIARSAFLWDVKTIPRAGKKNNSFYYSGLLISLVSAIVILSASWIFSPNFSSGSISLFTVSIALYHFIFQIFCYSLFLDYIPIQ